MAWTKLGSASVGGAIANNSWKELARITAGSGGSTSLTTSTFTPKTNMMILYNSIGSDPQLRVGNSSIDTGGNYCQRYSENGGSDGSQSSSPHNAYWYVNGGAGASGSEHVFGVADGINYSTAEKLFILNSADNATGTGAGNTSGRYERSMKWANTSSQINIARLFSSGTMAEGSELIILGFDHDDADEGTNFWQELASVTRTDNGSTLESGNFATKKYLMVEACTIPANNGFKGRLEFGHSNGTMDTGSNYADRYEHDGGSDSTNTNHQYIYAYTNHDDNIQHLKMFIVNNSDKEKLVIWSASSAGSSTGSGNVSQRRKGVAKWTNVSNQITNIRLNNQVAGGDAGSGSFIKVYGAD